VEAKRRHAAGEFGTLRQAQLAVARERGLSSWAALKEHIEGAGPPSHPLAQVRWVMSRFAAAGAPQWVAPGEEELREGLVVAGAGAGGEVWASARGWASLDQGGELRPEHRFPAYSVTKLVTAVAVLRLVADGRVHLDAPARAYLRTVRLADGAITVGELLSHTGGANNSDSGVVEPIPASVAAVPAVGGLWTTATDLARFGHAWSSLLPQPLAREALTPQAERNDGPGGQVGLGRMLNRPKDIAGHPGAGPRLLRVPDHPTGPGRYLGRPHQPPGAGRGRQRAPGPTHRLTDSGM
jgi:CubicO group peptidase (beta-lactamase class C family)